MAESRSGGCLCGAVRYIVSGRPRGVVYCHCSQCRRQTGHYYAATTVPVADLSLTGEENLTWYRASDFARRGFCATCGSALFWLADEADTISVMAGSFDSPSGLEGEVHIFVADKGDYYEITDGLPEYDRSTPDIAVAGDDPA